MVLKVLVCDFLSKLVVIFHIHHICPLFRVLRSMRSWLLFLLSSHLELRLEHIIQLNLVDFFLLSVLLFGLEVHHTSRVSHLVNVKALHMFLGGAHPPFTLLLIHFLPYRLLLLLLPLEQVALRIYPVVDAREEVPFRSGLDRLSKS